MKFVLIIFCLLAFSCLEKKQMKTEGNDKNIKETCQLLKDKYCQDDGVVGIWEGERFSDAVVTIECVTKEDSKRIKKEIGNIYNNTVIHFNSPIWGVGELAKDGKARVSFLMEDQNARIAESEEWKKRNLELQRISEEDHLVWQNMSNEDKEKWLSDYIKMKRKINPEYANCGDKFIIN